MDQFNNIAEGIGNLGGLVDGFNPVEEISSQAQDTVGGLGESVGQIGEQLEGGIGNILGGL